MDKMEYKSDLMAEAKAEYDSVHLEGPHRALVNYLGSFVGPRLGMEELPCRGYWVMAVQAWQKDKKRPIASILSQGAAVRIEAAGEIAGHFRRLVARALVDPTQQARMEEALREAMVHTVNAIHADTEGGHKKT